MSKSHKDEELRSLLKKVRELEIKSKKKAESLLAGEYKTVFRGSGIEFEEVREYIRGDDTRSIDWNVTAKTGKLFVKKFSEERELVVYIMIDVSGSNLFGTTLQFKKQLAIEISALLAISAAKSKDKVGLVLFSDEIVKFIPAGKGRGHILRLIRETFTVKAENSKTDLKLALDFINKVQKRKSIIFLISDFYDVGYMNSLKITNNRHDLIPVVLRDRMELELPRLGLLKLKDPETGNIALVNSNSKKVRLDFKRMSIKRDDALKNEFRRNNIDTLFVETDTPYLPKLMGFFKKRAARY